ncbi:MAG: VOC family protein [Streptosporangiaceae bacterium]
MANRLTGITIDCADPARLASFWSVLLDGAMTGEHGDDAGWATVGSRLDDRPRLTFQRVAEPKTTKVRIHLDVQVDDIGVARRHVERLGGRWSGERHECDEGVVMVMHDPEGDEFCRHAERPLMLRRLSPSDGHPAARPRDREDLAALRRAVRVTRVA